MGRVVTGVGGTTAQWLALVAVDMDSVGDVLVSKTNFSPSEVNLIWTKSAVSARDLLLMLFTSLKHCAEVTNAGLVESGFRFKNFPAARYAMDVTFQQTNVPTGEYEEKKLYFSGNHSLYGHEVEVSVVPNGFAIDCTKFYKGSMSDKTIFNENIDSHLPNLAKRTGETTLKASELGMEQCAVLTEKGYQDIQHNVRVVLPLKKATGGMLTFAEQAKNDHIASDRVIVQNYLVG
ncbi:hypothetical protein H257_15402 [Aphanomyces astaci]|uniref:DDE Tnp4 domain-containing protein n=1 Tax=Aphanomyces astaci TaxID=112090 RepID=W4FPI0_APHAT|nr:hypothetical protein H257_15402 [Aphanomyces astaci]ETV68861.1 hypothetical protein H257_15402 [Aphanomyces astaci]|eukprot:XP_009841815.1 hypothetical protein H257_15402 [Aphanomyces astaci]